MIPYFNNDIFSFSEIIEIFLLVPFESVGLELLKLSPFLFESSQNHSCLCNTFFDLLLGISLPLEVVIGLLKVFKVVLYTIQSLCERVHLISPKTYIDRNLALSHLFPYLINFIIEIICFVCFLLDVSMGILKVINHFLEGCCIKFVEVGPGDGFSFPLLLLVCLSKIV